MKKISVHPEICQASTIAGFNLSDFIWVVDCNVIFATAMAYAWFKLSDMITPLRVDAETEAEGLDAPEVGVVAYPDFPIHRGSARIHE